MQWSLRFQIRNYWNSTKHMSANAFNDSKQFFRGNLKLEMAFYIRHALTIIRQFWGKNPKRGTVAERVFRENAERSISSIYISFRALNFFR